MATQVNRSRPTCRLAQPFDLILQSACNNNSPSEVRLLFALLSQQGVELDEVNASGMTALTQCALDGNLRCVQTLVELGAGVNTTDKHGWTALHHAVSEGYSDIVRFLLRCEADVHVLNRDGETALDLAQTEELRTLLPHRVGPFFSVWQTITQTRRKNVRH